MIEFLAWFTVVGIPALLIIGLTIFAIRWFRRTKPVSQPYAYTPPPPTWTETKTTITTTEDPPSPPNFADLSIDEKEWDDEYPGESKSDDMDCGAHIRIYRTYRSVDRKSWVECDPALTERAACNYAAYIKRNNPKEYVRCEDPDGLVLFYE